jgi:hypothetical protein
VVDALFDPDASAVPRESLRERQVVTESTVVEWGLGLVLDPERFVEALLLFGAALAAAAVAGAFVGWFVPVSGPPNARPGARPGPVHVVVLGERVAVSMVLRHQARRW